MNQNYENIIEVKDLCVEADGKQLIHNLNLAIPKGEVHAVLGQNGSGKTSLMMTIMGFSDYEVTSGRIFFKGQDITEMDVYERAEIGISILQQRPPTVDGVTLRQILNHILKDEENPEEKINQLSKETRMENFLNRSINDCLSGGEIKRAELLQLLAIKPEFTMMDEPDSGVDIEALSLVGNLVNRVLQGQQLDREEKKSGIVITHTGSILNYFNIDKAHVMHEGQIGCSGNPRDILDMVSEYGYEYCVQQLRGGSKMIPSMNLLERADMESLASVGILMNNEQRASTLVIKNHQQVCYETSNEGFEMLPIAIALKKYDWLREKYFFKAIPVDYDDVSQKCAAQEKQLGYFIHVKKGAKVKLPCQAAMFMVTDDIEQVIHNVVILEDDSELQFVTGCTTQHSIEKGKHYAVEEHYVGKNAKLVSTMVHSWGAEVEVLSRSGTIVEENGQYESNYLSLKAAKSVVSNPQTYLQGRNATAKYLTVILGREGSFIETGGNIYLNAKGTSAELLHRGVSSGGVMHQKGMLIANAPCRAHVDCAAMIIDDSGKAFVESIPGLITTNEDARMSHEASIGKLAPEQVEYLMSKGLTEQEALSLLIRGFLGVEIEGLGEELDAQIAEIAEIAGHGEE